MDNIGAVLMASGFSCRMGQNKLLMDFNGKELVRYACQCLPEGVQGVVVTQYSAVEKIAREYNLMVVRNEKAHLGVSESIKLGLQKVCGSTHCIFLVCDEPFITTNCIQQLIDIALINPNCIVAAAHNGIRSNPVIFPQNLYCELLALEGNQPGGVVINRHPNRLILHEVGNILMDIDDVNSLNIAKGTIKNEL